MLNLRRASSSVLEGQLVGATLTKAILAVSGIKLLVSASGLSTDTLPRAEKYYSRIGIIIPRAC